MFSWFRKKNKKSQELLVSSIHKREVSHREINQEGLRIICSFEKGIMHSYDRDGKFYIGYNHPCESLERRLITPTEALELLKEDLSGLEQNLHKKATGRLTLNQFSALVSLSRDIGLDAILSSKLFESINKRDYSAIKDLFLAVGGNRERRRKELTLFNTKGNGTKLNWI